MACYGLFFMYFEWLADFMDCSQSAKGGWCRPRQSCLGWRGLDLGLVVLRTFKCGARVGALSDGHEVRGSVR